MFLNFGDFTDIYKAQLQVYLGAQIIHNQSIQTPRAILESSFMDLFNQISKDSRPMSVKMIIDIDIYDEQGNFVHTLHNSVEVNNYKREYEED